MTARLRLVIEHGEANPNPPVVVVDGPADYPEVDGFEFCAYHGWKRPRAFAKRLGLNLDCSGREVSEAEIDAAVRRLEEFAEREHRVRVIGARRGVEALITVATWPRRGGRKEVSK